MTEVFGRILSLFERIKLDAATAAYFLIIAGALVLLSLRFDLIKSPQHQLLANDLAVGALILGATIGSIRLISYAMSCQAARTAKEETVRSLKENIRFLESHSVVILLHALSQPNGRYSCLGPNSPSEERLFALNLIRSERLGGWIKGNMMRVAPQLYAVRSDIEPILHEMASVSGLNTRDPGAIEELRKAIIEDEAPRSRFGNY